MTFSSVQFSCSVVSSSLRPHGLQHTRPPCPSPTPGAYSNSCPIKLVMPSNHLIICHPLLLPPSIFPRIRDFSNDGSKVPISSVAQSCPTPCDPMDCSMPGFPVYHQLPELAQTDVHQVSDGIQPSHPLSSPSPPALNLSQHQGLFQ